MELIRTNIQKPNWCEEFEKYFNRLISRNDLGYLKAPQNKSAVSSAVRMADGLKTFAKKMIVLGMGGSCLGAKALLQFHDPFGEKVECWDSIDPIFLVRKFKNLEKSFNLSEVCWVAISKSGNTLETIGMINFVYQMYNRNGANPQFTIITEDKPSALKMFSIEHQCNFLEHPRDVGGRFSALTVVGLLPYFFADGALGDLELHTQKVLEDKKTLIDLACYLRQLWEQEKWLGIFWVYEESLAEFGPWLQQLWSESLAKLKTRSGGSVQRVSNCLYLTGSRDQHSVLQQINEGFADKFVLFFDVCTKENFKTTVTNLFPTHDFFSRYSLEEVNKAELNSCIDGVEYHGVPYIHFKCNHVFELIYAFEIVIGLLGEYLDINAFDQPGVEYGKKKILEILK